MTERYCPEFLAFQRNYVVLHSLRHGIESITSKAFAAEIINTDLRNKCMDKRLSDKDRMTCLLDALGEKMPHLPETLQKFVKILNETCSFEYIAEKLLTSLRAARKELEMQENMDPRTVSFSHALHTAANLQGSAELLSLSEARLELLRKRELGRIYTIPTAATLPGKSNLIIGATHPRNSSLVTAATFPGNLNTTAWVRDASTQRVSRKSSLRVSIAGNSVLPFNTQEEGRGGTVTTPPATPTQRPILERR